MNNLVKINNQDLQVKELNNQRVVTFKDIDTLHERVNGTARRNFNDNKDKFIEGTDYFNLTFEEARSTNFVQRPNSQGLTLITESGYLMVVKSLTDNLAWQVQRELVNSYFRAKEANPSCIEDLIIMQAQSLKDIRQQLNQVSTHVLEANRKVEENKEEVQAIRDIIVLNPNSWRKDSSSIINKIALATGGYDHIKVIREESYKLLEQRMGVQLSIRLTNKRRRMADEGVCKSKRDRLTILDVIADDKKLIEGYVAIVKEMAIKSGV